MLKCAVWSKIFQFLLLKKYLIFIENISLKIFQLLDKGQKAETLQFSEIKL